MSTKIVLEEAHAFDAQIEERVKHGFIPDLRRLKKVSWFYNNVWRDPEFVKIHLLPDIEYIIQIAKKRGGKVAEIGCGSGFLSLELARNGLDVIGIDISPKNIEISKKYAKENPYKKTFGSLEYICFDIYTHKLEKNKYDTVIFFGTFHHLGNINEVIKNVFKALKSGGNLVLYEPFRAKLTKQQAEFIAILRAILPTWIPYEKKLQGLDNTTAWNQYIEKIFDEYSYTGDHTQSPCDNSVQSEEMLVQTIQKYFRIISIKHSNVFIKQLIGGLRGKHKYILARFLQFIDGEFSKKRTFPSLHIRLHAQKT